MQSAQKHDLVNRTVNRLLLFMLIWCLHAGQVEAVPFLSPQAGAGNAQGTSKVPDQPDQREPLRWGFVGNGVASDGTRLTLGGLNLPDGTRVAVTSGKFRSSDAAKNELRLMVRSATRIVEKGVARDRGGRLIGDRVVAVFEKTPDHPEYYAAVWTAGPDLHWMSSAKLAAVLQAEKDLRENTHADDGTKK